MMKVGLKSVVRVMSVALLIAAFGMPAQALPVVDGTFDPSEGYTVKRALNFYDGDEYKPEDLVLSGGALWTYCDPVTKDLYVALIQPLMVTDNTYAKKDGPDADGGEGYVAGDWGTQEHSFGKLEGSDKAEFDIKDGNGNILLNFEIDYIKQDKNTAVLSAPLKDDGGYITQHSTSLIYNLAATSGVGTGLDYGTATATRSARLDYSPEIVGGYDKTTTPVTQVDYTLRNADLGDSDGDLGTEYTGWVFESIYEFKVDGSLFGDTCGVAEVHSVHNSPHKVGEGNELHTEVSAGLGDYVWHDLNEDGIQDANEPGVDGVTVNLYGTGDDGEIGGGDDALLDTMLTSGGGNYLFDGLQAGNYFVEFILPDGFDGFTAQDLGLDDAIDSDADLIIGRTGLISLEDEELDLTWDAGLVDSPIETDPPIAEPATALLLLGSLIGLRARRRRRRN
jgi:SdrD B-like protein